MTETRSETEPIEGVPIEADLADLVKDDPYTRVAFTPAAVEMLQILREQHGPLMFHQSGGCCDGSAPMCFPRSEFIVGDADVLLGVLRDGDAETPVWISGSQFELWKHTQLLLDVVAGRGAGFSVEAPEGVRFLTRSRVFDPAEQAWLEACPAPRGRDGPGCAAGSTPVPSTSEAPG